jgi:hypothetical protein
MPDDRPVHDEDILAGFASLHQAMITGFDQMRSEFLGELHAQIGSLRSEMQTQFHDVRIDIARLEHRMLRRFDEVDARLDNHEVRITALEARP